MPTDTQDTPSWAARLISSARSTLGSIFPAFGAVDAAREFISEAVAQRIRDLACEKARTLIAEAHRSVIFNIIWQNALLILSMVPVYFLHSAAPFYVAYACVLGYTLYTTFQYRNIMFRLCRTRSITTTLSQEIFDALETELTQRQFYERKAVEWLGPDLQRLSGDVARKLKPDVMAAVFNLAFTLFMAFLAFRVFAIPLLEHHALAH